MSSENSSEEHEENVFACFEGAGETPGIEIWRVENLTPVRVDPHTYGTFYEGDSYIILRTNENDQSGARSRRHRIHFWLGNESTKDETGAAAVLTVDLDDFLGGSAVQTRETQGKESKIFLSFFPHGIKILEGGIDGAFNHVDPDAYEPRLLHLKGKRNDVRVSQVKLSYESLNHGDVFILDSGLVLYQWNGKDSNKYEKFKAMGMITNIRDEERAGRGRLVFLEGGINDNEEDAEDFWKILGGKGPIKSAEEGGDDEDVSAYQEVQMIQVVIDEDGELQSVVVQTGKLDKENLKEDGVFLVMTGMEMFVWIGKRAPKFLRKAGMMIANSSIDIPIVRITQNTETSVFKNLFLQWDAPKIIRYQSVNKPAEKQRKSDVSALFNTAEKNEAVLDGAESLGGDLTVWRVNNFQLEEIPPEQHGQFYSGDSYVILYEYAAATRVKQILYMWQGKDSTADEKGSSALLATEVEKKLEEEGKVAVTIRIVQNKEPNFFYSIFKGKMIVHSGGVESGFDLKTKRKSSIISEEAKIRLYQIKGTNSVNTRAVEITPTASMLNSGDVFVVLSDSLMYVWIGMGANEEEKKYANVISSILQEDRKVEFIEEENEPDEFWASLGGKKEYARSQILVTGSFEPRLFMGTDKRGHFELEEIPNFAQSDLTLDDVFLLDTYEEVWVWIGPDSTELERQEIMKAALKYAKECPDGRSPDTPVFKIEPGNEPGHFTAHFFPWDENMFVDDPYMKKLRELKGQKAVAKIQESDDLYSHLNPHKNKFPYADLIAKGKVEGIDVKHKENYLTDEEFEEYFKMKRTQFEELPVWKKKNIKMKLKLF